MYSTSSLLVLALAALANAKTDIAGCTSSQVIAFGGDSLLYYVPGTGEICSFLDCGGGQAPPKTTVPGCPGYDGTATVTPSFLPNFGAATSAASSIVASATSTGGDFNAQTTMPVSSPSFTDKVITSTVPSITSMPTQTGSGTATAVSSSLTDTGIVVATSSPAPAGVDGSSVASLAGTGSSTSSVPPSSVSGNAAAATAAIAQGAMGLLAVAAVALVL